MSDEPIRIEVAEGSEISTLELKDVLIFRGSTYFGSEHPEVLQQLAELTGSLIVELPEGASLESLSDAEMARAGWTRTPASLSPCDCGTHYKQAT